VLFGIPAINGRFFHRRLIDQIKGFTPKAGLAADREFMLRVVNAGFVGRNIKTTLYNYRIHAGSKTIAGDKLSQKRVLNAEIELASYLLQADFWSDKYFSLLNQVRILASLKQHILYGRQKHQTDERERAEPLPDWFQWRYVPAALVHWHSWRGKLSGY